MKKILAMLLSVAIIASIAIGGTVAFLSDSDGAVNTMTAGNVFVEQYEQERKKDANDVSQKDDSNKIILEDFAQNQQIVSAVYENQKKEEVTVGDYTIQMRDQSVRNYVDKIVTAKNTGTADAYVRTIIAIPSYDSKDNASENWLHWNGIADDDTDVEYNGAPDKTNGWMWGVKDSEGKYIAWPGNTNGWDMVTGVKITVNGVEKEYDLYIATNKNVIKGGETTAPNLVGFYIDKRVNNEKKTDGTINYYFYDNKNERHDLGDISDLKILVMTQAVQANGFADAWTALDEAFGDITKDNHPWKNGIDDPAAKARATELAAELRTLESLNNNDTKTIALQQGATYDFSGIDWTPVGRTSNGNSRPNITIEGKNATIKGLKAPLFGDIAPGSITIKDLTIDGMNKEIKNEASTGNASQAYGAFIQYIDNESVAVTLSNCHLKNLKITSTQTGSEVGKYVGGLIGYSSASATEISGCSVENCNINGNGSVGGIVGHRMGGITISNCSVKNSNMTSKSTEDWRTGVIVGTLNGTGTATVTSFANSNNSVKQNSANNKSDIDTSTGNRDLYGRKYIAVTLDGNTVA